MATLIVTAATYAGASAATAAAIGTAVTVATTAATIASIGYSIYSALNQPSQRSEGPRLGDLAVQSSARGVPIPKVWGSMRIAGNLIDGKKYEERTEESLGGKFGGGGGTQVTYKYFADFAVSLCEGPITGVRRVWLNSKLWYTAADDASETELEASADHERYGKLYLGTTSQLPDPTLEAIHGAGNVPPYRRTAYIVFTRLPLENFGNAIPNVSVEVCNTPASFTAPTIHTGANDGGTFGTNMIREPETGRIFKTTSDNTYLRVFDSALSSSIRLISLPSKTTSEVDSTPCYVPTTREIWAPYNTAAGASLAIIDPDALVIKAVPTMSMTTPGPAFYNPAKDEVVVHDHSGGNQTLYFNPQTRVGVAGLNLFSGAALAGVYIGPGGSDNATCAETGGDVGALAYNDLYQFTILAADPNPSVAHAAYLADGWVIANYCTALPPVGAYFPSLWRKSIPAPALCYGCLYIAPHEVIAVWGADNRVRLVSANTYGLIADYEASEFGTTKNWVSYDSKRDVLYWCCGATTISRHLYTIDLDPLSHGGTPVRGSSRTLPYDPRDGMCWARSTDRIYIRDSAQSGADIFGLDAVTLADEQPIDGVTGTRPGLYPIDGKRFIVSGDYWKVPIKPLLPNSGELLSQIVQDLCKDAGLALGDLDTLALTDFVHGYVRAQPMQATAALQPLMLAYQFDGVESEYLLTFPKREGSSVGTIPEDDLGAREIGQDPGPPLSISRMQETDLPTALSIHYSEPALYYQQGSQIHRRVYTRSQQTMEIDLPIAMSATLARRLTRRLMNRSWVERTRYRFAVGPEYLWIEPGDIVKVLVDNATHLVRLDKVEFGAPGLVLAEGVAQRITLLPFLDEVAADLDAAPIYEEGGELPPPDEIPAPELAPVPSTRLVLLDLPIFLDQHNDAGFYYAVCGYAAGWHGAVLYKSTDSGATYAALDGMITPAAIGSATTALASGPTTIWDHGSSVNVYLTQGTLASDTEANVLAGTNMAALGAHGRWEVLAWQTATLESDGTYTLSNLLRGRKGTEHAVGSHAIGDTFVALTASVDRAPMQSGELGLERTYKGVSIGGSFAEAQAQGFTNGGVGLEPYSPVHLKAVNNGDGTYTVSWIRRTRAQAEWRDLVEDAPLFEDSESYRWEVWNGVTLASSGTVSVPSATVAASPGYTVKIAQISVLAGTGYYSEITA
jgi:hypothetical protein